VAELTKPAVAVAIPAYNEAEGLGDFVREIDRALTPHARSLHLVVVDDASQDDTTAVLESTRPDLRGTLQVVTSPANRGHGPSLLEAYRLALAGNPDFVLQVDGDGQFHGSDLRRVLILLGDGAHAVSGVRRFRQDPWFRMTMTRFVRLYVSWAFSVRARDPNCPLRGYDASLLSQLLESVPDGCLIPNLYLTILATRRGVAFLEVDVSHRVRRGMSAHGTSWAKARRSPIPWRLVRFSVQAMRESMRFRAQMDIPEWARHGDKVQSID
jgi:glycosyltransferase involved in cell wall biosynthesis